MLTLFLAAVEETLSRQAAGRARADFRLIAVLMPAVVLLAIALSLAITFAVRRRLLAEIHDIKAAASGLASGDLTVRERSYGGDEIGETSRALDASIRNLNGTLRSILDSARLIGAASRDIKLGNLSLGSRAVFRAGAMADAAGSMQELATSLGSSADSALAAHRAAASMGSALDQGGGVVERLVATLEAGKRSARRVVDIVDQLDLVAGETGTLALNAALEAVRALARRVAAASTEIRALAAQSVAEIDGGGLGGAGRQQHGKDLRRGAPGGGHRGPHRRGQRRPGQRPAGSEPGDRADGPGDAPELDPGGGSGGRAGRVAKGKRRRPARIAAGTPPSSGIPPAARLEPQVKGAYS